MGTGVLLGVLLAPDSGSRTGEVNEDGSGSGRFATRPREPLGGNRGSEYGEERSAS
jgi:hypothetical protein